MIRNIPNLILEGPDHKTEVGAKHPREDVDDDVYDVEADESSYDVEDAKGESHYSQAHPRTHEADVPRSGAVDEAVTDHDGEDCSDQHAHTNVEDSS